MSTTDVFSFNLTVINDTSLPLEGARVTFGYKTCTTSSTGKCIFTNLAYGTYELVVKMTDYYDYDDKVIIDSLSKDYAAIMSPEGSNTYLVTVKDSRGN